MDRQITYGIAVFISSACGLIIEIVAGRLIAPYVGMSLYTWTAIIAVVLAGLSAGHWIGGLLAAPAVDAKAGARRVAMALAGAAVSSLASLVLLRVIAGMLIGKGLGPIPVIVILTTALFLLPSLFVGIVSPILTKLAVDTSDHGVGRIIGRMYALGTLGSIAGTLSAGYLFISWIGSSGTVLAVTVTYALLAAAFAAADRFAIAVIAVIATGGGIFGLWGNRVQAFSSPCTVESDYFCIRVDNFGGVSGRISTLMALDHLVHSINDRDDPGYLYSPYIHAVDELTKERLGPDFAPKAFFIGGGGFTLPRAWAEDYSGKADLVVAEIDPAVTRAAETSMWLDAKAPGLSILHRDARESLQAIPAEPTFDVIFGDAFHDISVPAHLVTREFHSEIAKRLKPDGFYVVNAVDNGADPRFLFALIKTLKADFPAVEVWIESREATGPGRTTYVVTAGRKKTGQALLVSRRGPKRIWTQWLESDLRSRIEAAGPPLLTDDYAPVDRLMAPLLLEPVS